MSIVLHTLQSLQSCCFLFQEAFANLLAGLGGHGALKPAAHGEESAQQSGMNVILLSKILAVCG